jgi:hypothetical protein
LGPQEQEGTSLNETLPRQVTTSIQQCGSHEALTLSVSKQFAEYNESEPAGDDEKKHNQKVNSKFIWYGRGVDGTILTPLSAIAVKQSNPTIHTMQQSQQLLDYLAMQEPAILTYRKSEMVLVFHSNASYLNEEEAQS